MDPFDVLKLIKQAGKDNRESLQETVDSQIGLTATTILLQTQNQLWQRLLNADPNTEVDILDTEEVDDQEGPQQGE